MAAVCGDMTNSIERNSSGFRPSMRYPPALSSSIRDLFVSASLFENSTTHHDVHPTPSHNSELALVAPDLCEACSVCDLLIFFFLLPSSQLTQPLGASISPLFMFSQLSFSLTLTIYHCRGNVKIPHTRLLRGFNISVRKTSII